MVAAQEHQDMPLKTPLGSVTLSLVLVSHVVKPVGWGVGATHKGREGKKDCEQMTLASRCPWEEAECRRCGEIRLMQKESSLCGLRGNG